MAKKPPPPANVPGALPPSKAEDGFKQALDQKIGPLVPQQQRGEIVTRVYRMLVSENFSGPVPHPRHLREYEEILPGLAERMMAMAELSQSHNMEMDNKIVTGEIDDRARGMRYGFVALLIILAFAGYFGYAGRADLVTIFLGGAVLGAVGLFIKGRFGK